MLVILLTARSDLDNLNKRKLRHDLSQIKYCMITGSLELSVPYGPFMLKLVLVGHPQLQVMANGMLPALSFPNFKV